MRFTPRELVRKTQSELEGDGEGSVPQVKTWQHDLIP